jgi:uncharacterized protein (DUF305 family)
MPRRPARTATVAALAALCLGLVGCSADAEAEPEAVGERAVNVVKPGAPGEDSRVLDPSEMPSYAPEPVTEADVEFMQQMVGHHAQAIVMTALVPDRTTDEELRQFVGRMDLTQVAEIEQMQGWLEEQGEDVPAWDPVFGAQGGHSDGMAGMDMGDGEPMPGMATQEQLDALAAAEGEEFERLFMELMTQHHLGAMQMVEDLFAAGGGGEDEIFRLAAHIRSDQAIEIERMARMLADLDA